MKTNTSKFPTSLEVGGITYTIEYVDSASETDIEKRECLWGQIDYWTRTIRILKKNRTIKDIHHTVFHEMIHAISQQYKLNLENKETPLDKGEISDDESPFIDVFSLILFDTLTRNGWIKLGGS